MDNKGRLQRLQAWTGIKTFGMYIGVESRSWSVAEFEHYAETVKPNQPDVLYIKVGEIGQEWYNGQFPAIRELFLKQGIGVVPYVFCRPQTWQADADIAAKYAELAGGVCLDCEEQFINNNTQLWELTQRVRNQTTNVIMVSGYGDPLTAVPSWDFGALRVCDAYQPQWYIGWWSIYAARGYQTAFQWGDGQCYHQFMRVGLGADFPIQPATNVEGVNQSDLLGIGKYLLQWQAGFTVWEARDVTAEERAVFRESCQG